MKRMDTLKQVHDAWAHGGSVIVFDEDDENIQQLRNENNPSVQISNTVDTCEGHLVPPVSSEVTIDGGEVYQSHDEEEDNDDATDNNDSSTPVLLDAIRKEFQDVTLPPKLKKRGRPKGAEKTVIGLPRKKKRLDKPVPFLKKLPLDRERVILQWFVEPSDAEIVLA
ncbi:uncharacterized protein [Dysidea avara]|uniref:uncharacterized protein isoform X1 n=1 Tax=Dysidea avara TaxID=196820 RepID=UPI0033315543